MRLCAIIVTARIGIVTDAPASFFCDLKRRSTQIAIGELVAVLVALITLGSELSASTTSFFIDNLGVISALVKGTG